MNELEVNRRKFIEESELGLAWGMFGYMDELKDRIKTLEEQKDSAPLIQAYKIVFDELNGILKIAEDDIDALIDHVNMWESRTIKRRSTRAEESTLVFIYMLANLLAEHGAASFSKGNDKNPNLSYIHSVIMARYDIKNDNSGLKYDSFSNKYNAGKNVSPHSLPEKS